MTREEREDAIIFFEEVAKKDAIYAHYSKLAIEALQQEPILDKIKAEIEELSNTYYFGEFGAYTNRDDVNKIIDKYKAENEVQGDEIQGET